MTKEEEAINSLEKLINIRRNKAGQIKYDNCICSTTDLETVLNMLKEKDKEIEKYKKKNKDLSNQILLLYKEQDNYNARIDKKNTELKKKNEELDMYKDMNEIANFKVTDLLKLKQYDDLKKKVDRQDKMIDLMTECLLYDEELKFEVCKECESLKEEECGRPAHYYSVPVEKDCLKQYFERKATNDG